MFVGTLKIQKYILYLLYVFVFTFKTDTKLKLLSRK